MWNTKFQELLQKNFTEMKQRDKTFSLRNFATHVNLSPGALSEILRGQRRVSLQKAREIIAALPIPDDSLTSYLERAMQAAEQERVLLPEQAYAIISRWQNFALLSMLECHDHPQRVSEMAQRLGESENSVQESLNLLLEHGLIERTENFYRATGITWKTAEGIPSAAIRDSHINGLQLAERALSEIPVELRDFSTLIFPADASTLALARKEINRFRERLSKIMQGNKTNSVQRLSVQLFPLDQWGQIKNSKK